MPGLWQPRGPIFFPPLVCMETGLVAFDLQECEGGGGAVGM